MTPEEIVEFFSKAENADTFKEIAKSIGMVDKAEMEGLLTNKQRLELSLHKKTEKIKENDETLKKILNKFSVSSIEELEESLESGDTSKAKPDALKQYERKLSSLQKELDTKTASETKTLSKLHNLLKEQALIKSLADHKFDKKHYTLLTGYFKEKAKIETDDNGNESVYIDEGQGIPTPIGEYFKNYASTDSGKAYIEMPVTTGTRTPGLTTSGQSGFSRDEVGNNPEARKAYLAKIKSGESATLTK